MDSKQLAKQRRKKLVKKMTSAERRFKQLLVDQGINYRQQKIIFTNDWQFYIVDFFLPDHKLIIEIDGSHHLNQLTKDNRRTNALNALGYKVIRFQNHEVWQLTKVFL